LIDTGRDDIPIIEAAGQRTDDPASEGAESDDQVADDPPSSASSPDPADERRARHDLDDADFTNG
jgi:hypothetical protein